MAVKVETIEKNKVKLTITLSAESFDKAYQTPPSSMPIYSGPITLIPLIHISTISNIFNIYYFQFFFYRIQYPHISNSGSIQIIISL